MNKVMNNKYLLEIQKLVNQALSDMQALHASKKLANTPVTNTNFLTRWVSKSIKSQAFDTCVKNDLITWQKMSRSKGTATQLQDLFERIQQTFNTIHPDQKSLKPILDKQIEDFMDNMEAKGWEVVNEFEVTTKIQVFADQANSFVLCSKQCEECFEGDTLIKPMSFYVRGNHHEFIKQAFDFNFLLHKQTAYKSNVKYHGEYLIYPHNVSQQLPEIPLMKI